METLRKVATNALLIWIFIDSVVVSRYRTNKAHNRDRFSFVIIVLANTVSLGLGIWFAYAGPGRMRHGAPVQIIGLVLMGAGIFVRSLAIIQLGKFHTPNVAILDDHRVVDTGLYAHVRHPSYLGALMVFCGFGLALADWVSLLLMFVIPLPAYLLRIKEEESVLLKSLGGAYKAYAQHTKRLIPRLY
jgi:protein-S-isoprenylcysteine O-methyltransferase